MSPQPSVSVNARASELVTRLIADAAELGLTIAKGASGETVIDAGSKAEGGIEAGLRIARICLGGLAEVRLLPSQAMPRWPWTIGVRSSLPVIACLASQYAGWRLAHGKGKDAFFALGSGPARALARGEKLFEDLGYADRADRAVMILESDRGPPPAVVAEVATACGLDPDRLTFIFAPTQSRAGGVQVVARVLCLLAVPPVMLDGFMEPVIGFCQAMLALGLVRPYLRRTGEQKARGERGTRQKQFPELYYSCATFTFHVALLSFLD